MTKASIASAVLRSFLERIERIREDKKSLADDEKQVFAEAKADGFDTKTIRKVLTLRARAEAAAAAKRGPAEDRPS